MTRKGRRAWRRKGQHDEGDLYDDDEADGGALGLDEEGKDGQDEGEDWGEDNKFK